MTHFSFFIAVLGLFLAFLFPVFLHGRGKSPNQSLELTAIVASDPAHSLSFCR